MDKAPEAFRTISEVADELEVPKHVLRFWEAKFAQLKPMKRGGGRRYYRPEDVALLRGIRFLLYGDGYTIRGVQKILREHGPRYVMDYRRLAQEAEDDEDIAPRGIPNVAAEAALSGGSFVTGRRGREEHGHQLDSDMIGGVLDEIEACQRILAAASTKD
ncbi:MAG: MerR family transcriptional regulator [Methyloceanibacter sp.]